MEHYYFFRESQARPDASITQIRALQIQSYSFLLGINTYESLKLNIKIGTGVSYHDSWIGKYLVNDPTVINDNPSYKSNKISPVLWSSLDYFYEKNFFFKLNIRLNPMLRPFASEQGSECNVSQIHNRISYGLAQLALGYRF